MPKKTTLCHAWALASNKIIKNQAILGSKTLSDLYDLEIVDCNLQDNPDNLTTFFLVRI